VTLSIATLLHNPFRLNRSRVALEEPEHMEICSEKVQDNDLNLEFVGLLQFASGCLTFLDHTNRLPEL